MIKAVVIRQIGRGELDDGHSGEEYEKKQNGRKDAFIHGIVYQGLLNLGRLV